MFTVDELKYAQSYPFSSLARRIVMESKLSVDNIPDEVLRRAKTMIVAVSQSKPYRPKIESSRELLMNEILAFPAAKIMLSQMKKPELYSKFADLVSNNALETMLQEKDRVLYDLAEDLGAQYKMSDGKNYFAEIPLLSYLQSNVKSEFLRLVNKPVEKGTVYLTRNDFCRYLAGLAHTQILSTMPVDLPGISQSMKKYSSSVSNEVEAERKKYFSQITMGKLQPEQFPPCMQKLYEDLLAGKNLNHNARFFVSTFLVAAGISTEQLIALFKNTPNFNEKITRYQVERLAGKGGSAYSPASCEKMKTAGLCIAQCSVKNPISYYRREVAKAVKNSKKKSSG